jgi:predicted alpha/beta hydrolase
VHWALWHGVVPVVPRLIGYYPAALPGFGVDLPRGVIQDWARWCRHPAYVVDQDGRSEEAAFRRWPGRLTALSFTDDELMPPRGANALLDWYRRPGFTHRLVAPAEFGLARIGHLGFFRPDSRAAWALLKAD